jgi:hypothetical protein
MSFRTHVRNLQKEIDFSVASLHRNDICISVIVRSYNLLNDSALGRLNKTDQFFDILVVFF